MKHCTSALVVSMAAVVIAMACGGGDERMPMDAYMVRVATLASNLDG